MNGKSFIFLLVPDVPTFFLANFKETFRLFVFQYYFSLGYILIEKIRIRSGFEFHFC